MNSEIRFYISVFFRRLHYFLLVFLLCAAGGVAVAIVLPTKYQSDALLLVDAPQPMAAVLEAAVKEVAGPEGRVTHLVYSHAHQDHISGAAAVLDAFPDAEVRL